MEFSDSHTDSSLNISHQKLKKTRREIQDEIRKEKALLKSERKAAFRRKTEKKLAEKAERKIMHKKNNTKRKLEKKLGIRPVESKLPETPPKKKV